MSDVINNAHDKIFKDIITDRENAISLLKSILPESVQSYLFLEKITYEKDSFVSKNLQECYSDLLTSVPVVDNEQEAKIYFLFEHKSMKETKAPLQLLRYILEIWEQYDKINWEPGKKLPIIIPIIISHAKEGWVRKRVADFIDLPSEEFRAFIPDFDFVLFDSVRENPEDYDFTKALQALLLIWKYFHRPEFIQMLQRAFRLMKQAYPDLKLRDFLEPVMNYLYSVRNEEEYIDIYKMAEEEFSKGDEYMGTIAEMFERKGEQRKEQEFLQYKEKWISEAKSEGRVEGKVETAQEMLIELLEDELDVPSKTMIYNIRSVNSYEILRGLFKKARKVNSLEEFARELDRVLKA